MSYVPPNSQSSQTAIQSIEELMLAGFQARFQQVFNCLVIYTTSTDRTRLVQRMFQGRDVVYPYAFITLQSISPNHNSYNSNSLARNGLIALTNGSQASRVRLIPMNFELEIEYITNKFQSFDPNSVLSFVRRWMFARKNGYLKFNVNYGRLAISIGTTLNSSTSTPLRESVLDAESTYKIVNTITLHGYISEPVLGSIGVIQDIDVNGVSVTAASSGLPVDGFQFIPFNK